MNSLDRHMVAAAAPDVVRDGSTRPLPPARPLAVMARQCTGVGPRGVVCAAAPLAAQAGAAVLREGGNAYDAVVAMGLAETVLLPPKCGLGGDLIALAHGPDAPGADAGEPHALIAVGGAPAGLADVATGGAWRDVGPTSVGPPAAAAGWLALAAQGRLALDQLAAPAVELACGGFPWADVCTDLARQSRALLAEMNPDGCAYLPDGQAIPAGTLVRLPGLAAVIESFVALRSDFLAGPVGDAIVGAVRERGGVLTHDDLRGATAEWMPCARREVAGRVVWATPLPTHGPSLLDALDGASAHDAPVDEYRRVLAALARRADMASGRAGTSMVSACDPHGNVVTVLHSNSYPRFGSGIVVAEYDLVLANRAGRGFTPVPGHPNFPAPGQRPLTTLHAWAVSDEAGHDGAVRFVGGTPGGDNQMPWNCQSIGQIVAGVDDPGMLVCSPRWEWLPVDDGVRVEDGFADDDVAALAAVAPRLLRTERWGMRSAQQVVVVPRPGEAARGAADPRTVGAALGT